MAVAIPVLMYASAAVAAVGAIQQGKAAHAAAKFNAITNMQNAEMARGEAMLRAQQVERETALRLGSIRAAQGASGGTAEGSFLDVIGDVARQGELEKQFQLYRGEAEARGYKNTATLDLAQGKAARTASYLSAGTELLSGAAAGRQAEGRLTRTG